MVCLTLFRIVLLRVVLLLLHIIFIHRYYLSHSNLIYLLIYLFIAIIIVVFLFRSCNSKNARPILHIVNFNLFNIYLRLLYNNSLAFVMMMISFFSSTFFSNADVKCENSPLAPPVGEQLSLLH